MNHGDGDEGLAIDMELDADRINATPQPDWDRLEQLREQAAEKGADRAELWAEAQSLIPKDRDDVLAEYREAILGR
jgi:hypothetical protein